MRTYNTNPYRILALQEMQTTDGSLPTHDKEVMRKDKAAFANSLGPQYREKRAAIHK